MCLETNSNIKLKIAKIEAAIMSSELFCPVLMAKGKDRRKSRCGVSLTSRVRKTSRKPAANKKTALLFEKLFALSLSFS
jgi:hypothetical protein